MSSELVLTKKYRKRIPEQHRASIDTRLQWLWNQRFGTVQTIYNHSPDLLDHTAAMLVIQAIMGPDLESISQLFHRIEGGAVTDEELVNDRTVRV